jgi:NAD(P)-dependent dehydrogenase (short-subunit alcohol dehydrogenase family)
MAVNARGPFLCYKYAAQQMIKQERGGRIIGASSILGKSGVPLCASYGASKFAVRGLTQTAGKGHVLSSYSERRILIKSALELGRYNITVNSYAPGLIKTPLRKCRCIRS